MAALADYDAKIVDLARRVALGCITVEVPNKRGNGATLYFFEGFECRVRRVAMLLKAHGIPAKATSRDPFVRDFKALNRDFAVAEMNRVGAEINTTLAAPV
jgi:hypothetical protein